MFNRIKKAVFGCLLALSFTSCSYIDQVVIFFNKKSEQIKSASDESYIKMQENLQNILKDNLTIETRYAVVSRLANNMLSVKDYNGVILFLTNWVEQHPEDQYNGYWLLTVAHAYMQLDSMPMAEYYFERIINNYNDLIVQGKSIHFLSYQYLVQISTNSANRIYYLNQLISKFPGEVSTTELYYRLAMEYENEGEWDQALKTLTKFLAQDDASSIVIAGAPNAYSEAKQLIDFSNSTKIWTFASLNGLVRTLKTAMDNYNWLAMDRYRSKVNFFAISWRQDTEDTTLPDDFSMGNFMTGDNKIKYSNTLDESSTATEAYLKTSGWSNYVSTWYLYFRKVNFPADPDIHGRWEWAGIYYGEKM